MYIIWLYLVVWCSFNDAPKNPKGAVETSFGYGLQVQIHKKSIGRIQYETINTQGEEVGSQRRLFEETPGGCRGK